MSRARTPDRIEGAASRHRSLLPFGTRPRGFAAGSPIVRVGALTLVVLAGGASAARAQTPDAPPSAPAPDAARPKVGKVSEVRSSAEGYGTTVLVDLGGRGGVTVGQTIEVRREGATIGYGSVDTAFDDVAVATVGTIVTGASPLRPGDEVVFRGDGFQRPAPSAPAPAPNAPKGRVVSVRDGLVLIEFARDAGVDVGHEVQVQDAKGAERGRVSIELVNGATSGGLLISGEAAQGDAALSLGRVDRGGSSIDFVALSFLGVVADLEHPTPHRSPCHVGVPVRRVLAGSPAQRAGIARNDRVIAVDGIIVREVIAIRERVEARQGDRVQVTLLRGDRILTVDVRFK